MGQNPTSATRLMQGRLEQTSGGLISHTTWGALPHPCNQFACRPAGRIAASQAADAGPAPCQAHGAVEKPEFSLPCHGRDRGFKARQPRQDFKWRITMAKLTISQAMGWKTGNCHPQWQRFEDRNLLIVDCEALPLLIITLVGCWLFQTIL